MTENQKPAEWMRKAAKEIFDIKYSVHNRGVGVQRKTFAAIIAEHVPKPSLTAKAEEAAKKCTELFITTKHGGYRVVDYSRRPDAETGFAPIIQTAIDAATGPLRAEIVCDVHRIKAQEEADKLKATLARVRKANSYWIGRYSDLKSKLAEEETSE